MLEDLIMEMETEDSYVQILQHCLNPFQVVFPHDEDNEYTNLPTNQPVRPVNFVLFLLSECCKRIHRVQ